MKPRPARGPRERVGVQAFLRGLSSLMRHAERLARSRGLAAEDAEDAVQEAALLLLERGRQRDAQAVLQARRWSYGVVRHLLADRQRQLARERRQRHGASLVRDPGRHVDVAALRRRLARRLAHAEGRLARDQLERLRELADEATPGGDGGSPDHAGRRYLGALHVLTASPERPSDDALPPHLRALRGGRRARWPHIWKLRAEGCSYRRIAEIVGISEGGARAAMHAIRRLSTAAGDRPQTPQAADDHVGEPAPTPVRRRADADARGDGVPSPGAFS